MRDCLRPKSIFQEVASTFFLYAFPVSFVQRPACDLKEIGMQSCKVKHLFYL